jgi:hypothetical protein
MLHFVEGLKENVLNRQLWSRYRIRAIFCELKEASLIYYMRYAIERCKSLKIVIIWRKVVQDYHFWKEKRFYYRFKVRTHRYTTLHTKSQTIYHLRQWEHPMLGSSEPLPFSPALRSRQIWWIDLPTRCLSWIPSIGQRQEQICFHLCAFKGFKRPSYPDKSYQVRI